MVRLIRLGALLLLVAFCGCKKLVEQKQKDLLLQTITNGEWYVDMYIEGSASITESFTGYLFQFKSNGSVLSQKDAVTTTGIWSGDINNYAISSNFASAPDPLKKLNGTWKIIDSDSEYVAAEMDTSPGKKYPAPKEKPIIATLPGGYLHK